MSFHIVLNKRNPEYAQYLRERGFDVTEVELAENSEDEVIEKMDGFEAVIAMGEPFPIRVLDALGNHLRIIVRHGIGYDMVDVQHAANLGICCCNTPGAMSAGVAETAVIMMLECTRGLYRRHNEMVAGIWNWGPATHELEGKTVGFVGFGNIARRTARYLAGFNCRLLAYDIAFDEAALQHLGVEKANLDIIAAESDFVSLHLPFNEKTAKIINTEFFKKMKSSAFLINTARGGVVDEAALIEALKTGRIAGAGLDAYSIEPLPLDSELRRLDNVFLTPHCSTNTYECTLEVLKSLVCIFQEFQAGNVPESCLNRDYIKNLR
jgi:D-3-phosphoglycerate dehydrogenase